MKVMAIGLMVMSVSFLAYHVVADVPWQSTDQSSIKTPSGPVWPENFRCSFLIPEPVPLNKPFAVKVGVTAVMFDAECEVAVLIAGDGLKSGEKDLRWEKKVFRKDETITIEMVVTAVQSGIAGRAGVILRSTTYYDELWQYIERQKEGCYGSMHAKASIRKLIEEQKKASPKWEVKNSAVIIVPEGKAGAQ